MKQTPVAEVLSNKLKASQFKRQRNQSLQNALVFFFPTVVIAFAIFLSYTPTEEEVTWPQESYKLKVLGDEDYRLNRYGKAIPSYEMSYQSLKDLNDERYHSKMANLANIIASCYVETNNWESAQEWFRHGIDVEPEHILLHFNYANQLLVHNDLTVAERHFRKVLDITPQHPKAMIGLSSVLRKQGLLDEPKQLLLEALKLEPNNPTTLGNLGLQYLAEKEVDKAVEYLQKAADQGHLGAKKQLDDLLAAILKTKEEITGTSSQKQKNTQELPKEDQRLDELF